MNTQLESMMTNLADGIVVDASAFPVLIKINAENDGSVKTEPIDRSDRDKGTKTKIFAATGTPAHRVDATVVGFVRDFETKELKQGQLKNVFLGSVEPFVAEFDVFSSGLYRAEGTVWIKPWANDAGRIQYSITAQRFVALEAPRPQKQD